VEEVFLVVTISKKVENVPAAEALFELVKTRMANFPEAKTSATISTHIEE